LKVVLHILFLMVAVCATVYNPFYSFLIIWASLCGILLCDYFVKTTEKSMKLIRYYQLFMWLLLVGSFGLALTYDA